MSSQIRGVFFERVFSCRSDQWRVEDQQTVRKPRGSVAPQGWAFSLLLSRLIQEIIHDKPRVPIPPPAKAAESLSFTMPEKQLHQGASTRHW